MSPLKAVVDVLVVGIFLCLVNTAFGEPAKKGVVSTEDGFIDIDLPIVDSKKTSAGVVTVIARGAIRGEIVGFALDVDPRWKSKPTTDKRIVFYWGSAQIRSIGKESDRFVQMLAKLYGRSSLKASMPKRIHADVVGLDNDPTDVFKTPTKMKFFFDPKSEDNEAEVFVNLDIPDKRLEFHEKDPEYREPLLRALGANL